MPVVLIVAQKVFAQVSLLERTAWESSQWNLLQTAIISVLVVVTFNQLRGCSLPKIVGAVAIQLGSQQVDLLLGLRPLLCFGLTEFFVFTLALIALQHLRSELHCLKAEERA